MTIGRFDEDSAALQKRIAAQSSMERYDLNAWILNALDVAEGQEILDLGCGTGKQTLALAESVGGDGHVVSMDISAESLDLLKKSASESGVDDRILTVLASLDALPQSVVGRRYNRIVASYSIYYASRPDLLLEYLEKLLKPGGILFFCGPQFDNNSETRDLIARISGGDRPAPTKAALFMEEGGPIAAERIFTRVERTEFENPIDFNSPDTLYKWWSSHNLYVPELEKAFLEAVQSHFETTDVFCNTKRVHGIKACKAT